MSGSQVTGLSVFETQSTRTSGTGTSSWITGSQVSPSCDSGTHGSSSSSPSTASQTTGTSSRRHLSNEDVEGGLPQAATSKKKKPSWLKELAKKAEESVGPPRREVTESRAP